MKVLILGGDGRAHALAWKLFNSPLATELVCAPGNGGTAQLLPSAELDPTQVASLARWAFDEGFDVIVPADSRSLQQGVVDEVISFHIGVSGPSQRSTVLERSRCQAKEFMLRHGLPSAPGRAFDNLPTAEKYLATQPLPLIVKADNPAAGEEIYTDRHAALMGLHDLFAARLIDLPNDGVVIERYLNGPRVVQSAFTDGRTAMPMLATRLYDRIDPQGSGPLAPGIGAHTGTSRFAKLLTEHLHHKLVEPIVAALERDGLPYWGILGIDCVITSEGPRLTAIRGSLRNGEAQVVLPRLEGDLLAWLQAALVKRLHELPPPQWSSMASVGIGLFHRSYPYHFPVGSPIGGLDQLDDGVLVFHNDTENPGALRYTPRAQKSGGLFGRLGGPGPSLSLRVSGGQPLMVVAQAATLAGARGRALINAERITFEGRAFRDDIGAKEFG